MCTYINKASSLACIEPRGTYLASTPSSLTDALTLHPTPVDLHSRRHHHFFFLTHSHPKKTFLLRYPYVYTNYRLGAKDHYTRKVTCRSVYVSVVRELKKRAVNTKNGAQLVCLSLSSPRSTTRRDIHDDDGAPGRDIRARALLWSRGYTFLLKFQHVRCASLFLSARLFSLDDTFANNNFFSSPSLFLLFSSARDSYCLRA